MTARDQLSRDLRAIVDILSEIAPSQVNLRDKYRFVDESNLISMTGYDWDTLTERFDIPMSNEYYVVFDEVTDRRVTSKAIRRLDNIEDLFCQINVGDENFGKCLRTLVQYAFNVGVMAANIPDYSDPQSVKRRKAERSLASSEKNRLRALRQRRALGEPTRDAARQLMKRKPHLSWTACANEIAGTRDSRGVARVIEELFPKDEGGRRRYIGDNPQEPPG